MNQPTLVKNINRLVDSAAVLLNNNLLIEMDAFKKFLTKEKEGLKQNKNLPKYSKIKINQENLNLLKTLTYMQITKKKITAKITKPLRMDLQEARQLRLPRRFHTLKGKLNSERKF